MTNEPRVMNVNGIFMCFKKLKCKTSWNPNNIFDTIVTCAITRHHVDSKQCMVAMNSTAHITIKYSGKYNLSSSIKCSWPMMTYDLYKMVELHATFRQTCMASKSSRAYCCNKVAKDLLPGIDQQASCTKEGHNGLISINNLFVCVVSPQNKINWIEAKLCLLIEFLVISNKLANLKICWLRNFQLFAYRAIVIISVSSM